MTYVHKIEILEFIFIALQSELHQLTLNPAKSAVVLFGKDRLQLESYNMKLRIGATDMILCIQLKAWTLF